MLTVDIQYHKATKTSVTEERNTPRLLQRQFIQHVMAKKHENIYIYFDRLCVSKAILLNKVIHVVL